MLDCSTRTCGAEDCRTCRPWNFVGDTYWEDLPLKDKLSYADARGIVYEGYYEDKEKQLTLTDERSDSCTS